MIQTYMNSSSSSPSPPFPVDLNYDYVDHYDDDDHHHQQQNPNLYFSSSNHQASSSSHTITHLSSSSTHHFFLNPTRPDQSHSYHAQFHQQNMVHMKNDDCGTTQTHKKIKCSDRVDAEVTTTMRKNIEDSNNKYNELFMSSNNSCSSNTIRVCADCNTTKTPLWRSGPNGPKSLCNACGIRQRKARRAMAMAMAAAAGAAGAETATATTTNKTTEVKSSPSTILKLKVQRKEKKPRICNNNQFNPRPFKKRCKFFATTTGETTSEPSSSACGEARRKQHAFEDFVKNLSESLSLRRVFPQDEKEAAAILLMAISCGLVHG